MLTTNTNTVMLSAAKHLRAYRARSFASLRMTRLVLVVKLHHRPLREFFYQGLQHLLILLFEDCAWIEQEHVA